MGRSGGIEGRAGTGGRARGLEGRGVESQSFAAEGLGRASRETYCAGQGRAQVLGFGYIVQYTTVEDTVCQFQGDASSVHYGSPPVLEIACDSDAKALFDACVMASMESGATFGKDDIAPFSVELEGPPGVGVAYPRLLL